MAKKRYEQKNEERASAIRERATAIKEKEKVRPTIFSKSISATRYPEMLWLILVGVLLTWSWAAAPFSFSFLIGDHGYVPATR